MADGDIQIDAPNVIHNAERSARHKLSHLEDEFLEEWNKLFTGMHDTAKRLLEFVAKRI
jgi:hypothetical protein